MNTPTTMKIQVISSSTLMGLVVDTAEVQVLSTFQVEIAGVHELFCIHPSHVRGSRLVASHYESGLRVLEMSDTAGHELVEEAAKSAVKKAIETRGSDWFAMTISAVDKVN